MAIATVGTETAIEIVTVTTEMATAVTVIEIGTAIATVMAEEEMINPGSDIMTAMLMMTHEPKEGIERVSRLSSASMRERLVGILAKYYLTPCVFSAVQSWVKSTYIKSRQFRLIEFIWHSQSDQLKSSSLMIATNGEDQTFNNESVLNYALAK